MTFMKFTHFVVAGCFFTAVFAASDGQTSQISDTDLDKALNDRRYLTRQLKCTVGEVPCDPVGKRLKSLAPSVIKGNCPQCTAQELRQIRKVLVYVQQNYPKEWSKLLQRYGSG